MGESTGLGWAVAEAVGAGGGLAEGVGVGAGADSQAQLTASSSEPAARQTARQRRVITRADGAAHIRAL